MNNYANIPHEMRPYNQWIVWRYEQRGDSKEPTKVPYSARSGFAASSTDPNTWCDFQTAITAAVNGRYDGIGFVLTGHDEFCFIDLDKTTDNAVLENQKHWYEVIQSYAERSPSKLGAHIICKAKLNGTGRRDGSKAIEVYDNLRFVTMTGDVIRNMPITNQQAQVDALIKSLGGPASVGNIVVHDEPQLESDTVVITKAMQAVNGSKVSDLFNGHWDRYYPSQSEADFALINELQWYTKNVEQIERIFYLSELGKREKALKRPKYVRDMIRRSFDRTPPPIDTTVWETYGAKVQAAGGWQTLQSTTAATGTGLNGTNATVAGSNRVGMEPSEPLQHVNGHVNPIADTSSIYTFPPGLIGEVAQYIYMNAPRPVPQIALAAAIAFIAGIVGRCYQTPTGLALNMYVNIIAETGTGKDAMKSGINSLVSRIARLTPGVNNGAVPAIVQFIGPSDFASDRALHNTFVDKPCFVSILSEFGLLLQNLTAVNANPYVKQLNRKFLALYTGADRDSVEGESARADKSQSTKPIFRPSFSFAAETTPDIYYQTLTDELVKNGYVSRILALPYEGARVDLNEYRCEPSATLISQLQALAVYCLDIIHQNKPVVMVQFDADAQAMQRDYEKRTTKYINDTRNGIYKHLLNRAHVKALKLSSENAVARNYLAPVVTAYDWNWAVGLVDHDIQHTMRKFESGETGRTLNVDDQKRNDLFKRFVRDYLTDPWSEVRKYSSGAQDAAYMHQMGVMTFYYISKRCSSVVFKRNEGNRLLEETLKEFVSRGWIYDHKSARSVNVNGSNPFTSTGRVLQIIEPDKFM